jgi:CheY-like chemotaxis protein
VLVIDDHVDGRELLSALLLADGHEVHEANDGPSGLAAARAVRPDVAIIDIGLPGLDGYEVARGLRASAEGRAIRLIALTGYGREADIRRARAAGFDAYLVKPVTPEQLNAALAASLAAVDPEQAPVR